MGLARLEGRSIFLSDQLLDKVLDDLCSPELRRDGSEWSENNRSLSDPLARRLMGYMFSWE